jgi:hypothetical protein
MNQTNSLVALSVVELLLLTTLVNPLLAGVTSFSSGSGSSVSDNVDGILATFTTTKQFSQFAEQSGSADPSLRNVGFADYVLSFSTPIQFLSFDVGGVDTSWGDRLYDFQIDGVPASLLIESPLNISQAFNLHTAVWNGSQLSPGLEQDNGARISFGSATISSLTFRSSGASDQSNHWILFDNFSFLRAVPEPSTFLLLSLAAITCLAIRRR